MKSSVRSGSVLLLILLMFGQGQGYAGVLPAFGTVQIAGNDWLQGHGVDVKSNGNTSYVSGLYNPDPASGGGMMWQCVELPLRLYNYRGWHRGLFGVGCAYELWDRAREIRMERHSNGSGYVPVPGDMVIMAGGPNGAGHVSVVDRIDDNFVYICEQNASYSGRASYPRSGVNGSSLTSNMASYTITGVLNDPDNPFTNGTSDPVWEVQLDTPASGSTIQGVVTVSGSARETTGLYPVEWVSIWVKGNQPDSIWQPFGVTGDGNTTWNPSANHFTCQWDTRPWIGQTVTLRVTPFSQNGKLGKDFFYGDIEILRPDPVWEVQLDTPTSGSTIQGVVTVSGSAHEATGLYPVEWVSVWVKGNQSDSIWQPFGVTGDGNTTWNPSANHFTCQWDTRPWAGQIVTLRVTPFAQNGTLGKDFSYANIQVIPTTSVEPALTGSSPVTGESLWRSQKNIVRLTFDGDITAPAAGQVTICEMLAGGTYGSDLSSGFTFTVENDGSGLPRILKIRENATALTHRKWYAVRNTGSWTAAGSFTVQYAVQVGDSSNDGRVLNQDVSVIRTGIPTSAAADDDRRDINGDGRILNGDASVANSKIPSNTVAKPSGH